MRVWWAGLEPVERVMYRGLGLVSAGFVAAAVLVTPALLPLALIVPGVVFVASAWRATPVASDEETT